ncbi:MAG TPA: GNAT family N-acetyltransferase [Acidimicrobiales bacterium]|jgi:GNAT superfamily N-acetyltransferase|nr:GNAT family N-acetyltransferase [Acidimicrobiales bacterium]
MSAASGAGAAGAESSPARLGTRDEIGAVAHALAMAFHDDPIWAWLTDDRMRQRPERAVPFFRTEARHYHKLDGCWTNDAQQGGALWAPPGRWKLGFVGILGLAPASLRLFGVRMPRALSSLDQIDKRHPTEPHYYLGFLGTHPDHQGRGVGSSLLAPTLARCDADGLPAYLESSKESNVPFYERHGFEVTETHDFPDGPRIWLMWREPRPPEA